MLSVKTYSSSDNAVPLIILPLIVIAAFRERLVPFLSRESIFIIAVGNVINALYIYMRYTGLDFVFIFNEQMVVEQLSNMPLDIAQAAAAVGLILFSIAKAYVASLKMPFMLLYAPYYGLCGYYLVTGKRLPMWSRVLIVIGSYMLLGMYASLIFVLSLAPIHFDGLTIALLLYQIIVCLAAFYLLVEFVAKLVRKDVRMKLAEHGKFYTERFIDAPLNMGVLVIVVIVYPLSYAYYVIMNSVDPLEWNMCAIVLSMIVIQVYRAKIMERAWRKITMLTKVFDGRS